MAPNDRASASSHRSSVRIKTDENVGKQAVDLLRHAGHDVLTVRDQKLSGESDDKVYAVCRAERRVLLTLDRGFGEPLRFPSGRSAGIVILELGAPATLKLIVERVSDFVTLAQTRSPEGELWIVEPGRTRIRMHNDKD